ncbi:MAG: DUF6273 domain-containing protein [Bacteroides sp.]
MEPKNNKKIIAIVGIVLALAVALIAGVLVIQATPANKLKRQIKLAEKYLTEMNYEQALIAYGEAIKIDPKCEQAYLAMADIYIKQGEAEKAVAILEEGQKNIQTDAMTEKIEEAKKKAASSGQTQQQTVETPTESPATAPAKTGIQSANVGEIITLGKYEQDNDTSNGAEPIEWIVLDNQGDKMLVMSRYALDCQPYSTVIVNVNWETCTLRNWLNNEFYNTAFNDDEKNLIRKTNLENPDNRKYGIKGCNATSDKVFCLSIDEANQYFLYGKIGAAKATAYAISKGVSLSSLSGSYAGDCYYWLRSPGNLQDYAALVGPDGEVAAAGRSVSYVGNAVCPAMWVDIQQLDKTTAQTSTEASSQKEIKSAKAGEIITLGYYEQDGNAGNGAEPIEWLVLDNQGDRMLVISRYALDCQPYNTTSADVTWETCTLRRWLNSEFYNSAFSDIEKVSVITTTIENPNNARYGTQGGNATSDNVFCLSIDEANRYFASDEARATKPATYAISRGASTATSSPYIEDTGNCHWWLRSLAYNQSCAAMVNYEGNIFDGGYSVHNLTCAVRPAMWVSIRN